jgi:hypothetical protein
MVPLGVVVQPDGKIVVVAQHYNATQHGDGLALTRLLGGPAAGRVMIEATAAVRRRAARIGLVCNARRACKGALTISSAGSRHVTFGRARFRLAPHARAIVRVALNRSALRRLRRAPDHLTVRVRATNRTAPATKRRVTLL